MVVFDVGDNVRAKFMATKMGPFGTKFLPGVISKVHPDPGKKHDMYRYDINYENGKFEANVKAQFVKEPLAGAAGAVAPTPRPELAPEAKQQEPKSVHKEVKRWRRGHPSVSQGQSAQRRVPAPRTIQAASGNQAEQSLSRRVRRRVRGEAVQGRRLRRRLRRAGARPRPRPRQTSACASRSTTRRGESSEDESSEEDAAASKSARASKGKASKPKKAVAESESEEYEQPSSEGSGDEESEAEAEAESEPEEVPKKKPAKAAPKPAARKPAARKAAAKAAAPDRKTKKPAWGRLRVGGGSDDDEEEDDDDDAFDEERAR